MLQNDYKLKGFSMNITKNLVKIALAISLFACHDNNSKQKKGDLVNESDSLTIIYYKLREDKSVKVDKIKEIIKLNSERINKELRYIYFYKTLQDSNDTLTIYQDSICMNSQKLKFLNEKKYRIEDKDVLLKKFIVDNLYASSNLYLNDKNQLVMLKSISSNVIVEYYNGFDPLSIHEFILKDSVFSKSEW